MEPARGSRIIPNISKWSGKSLAREAGVEILLNAWVQDVEAADHEVRTLITATKLGLRAFSATAFIDASGDADLCYFGGFGYELAGELDPAQTLTTTFKLCNVDAPRRQTLDKTRFHALMAEAADSGQYALPRREGSDHITPSDHMTATIMTRLPSFYTNGQNGCERHRSGIVVPGRNRWPQAGHRIHPIPARQGARLRTCATGFPTFGVQIGVRETRRVYGSIRLTKEDVLDARQFDDQIGLCGAPIEDHHNGADTAWHYLPEGRCVGMPFRTLVPKYSRNLLMAGRCFSSTHDAHASVRSMAQCMAMGHAAGTAAAMMVKQRLVPQEISVRQLQDALRRDRAVLELA